MKNLVFDRYYYNRPVSPHVSIYSIQIFSMLSILHRFSAMLLTAFLILSMLFMNLVQNLEFIEYAYHNHIHTIYAIIFWFLTMTFHGINGVRYILFSLRIYVNWKYMLIIFLTLVLLPLSIEILF